MEKLNQLYYNILLSTIYERGHDNEKQDRKIVSKIFKQEKCRHMNTLKKNEYYAFVEMIQKQGNNQCIFTSDIMLKFMEHFLYEHNAKITAINFMVEDESLQEEIFCVT